MKPATVLKATPADENHEVLTVKGGGGCMARPCPDCPWRRDSVGVFPAEAFIISAKTAYDMAESAFGCHSAGKDNPKTCTGFALRGATHNLAARIAQMKDGPYEATDGGVALFDNYREMAEANGVPADHPALAPIRTDV